MTKSGTIRVLPLLALLAFLAGSTTALAAGVEISYPQDADFSRYESYAWKERPEAEAGQPETVDFDLDRDIRAASDRALAARGLTLVAEANDKPDLWIVVTGFVLDEVQVEGVKKKLTRHVSWVGDPDSHSLRSHQEGTLVIELVDAASGKIVWSGWDTDAAESAARLRKKAVKTAAKILRNFPPKR